MTHPYISSAPSPTILAHRGFMSNAERADGIAENSFAAVAAANALGIDYVESDCHLTRDGVVVLFHDDSLMRVLGDPRKLADVDVKELTELMADKGGIITLEQALTSFPDTRFNIDVKAPSAATPAGRIVAKYADRVLLTSFSDASRAEALSATGTVRPATSPGQSLVIKLVLSVALGVRPLQRKLFRQIDALQIPQRFGPLRVLTKRMLHTAHANGVAVHVWTINDAPTMHRLLDMGVDGLVTDRADVALAVVKERAAR